MRAWLLLLIGCFAANSDASNPRIYHSITTVDYIEALTKLQPVVSPPLHQYETIAPFGPHMACIPSNNRELQFHSGVTLATQSTSLPKIPQPIMATYTGVVRAWEEGDEGRLHVLLEHSFDEWVQFHPDKGPTQKWFTQYEFFNHASPPYRKVGDRVETSETLGFMVASSLEYQVLVGASCSLQHARNHPASKCNRKGYEPQVNPMLLLTESTRDTWEPSWHHLQLNVKAALEPSIQQPGVLQIGSSDSCKTTSWNRLVVELLDQQHQVLQAHGLDVNLREGISEGNASLSLATVPHLSPPKLSSTANQGSSGAIDLVVPPSWLYEHPSDCKVRVSVYGVQNDLFGQVLL